MTRPPSDPFAQLKAILKGVPSGTITTIPHELVTPELRYALNQRSDPVSRLLELRNAAPDRELVVESGARLEQLVTTLLRSRTTETTGSVLFGDNGRLRDYDIKIELAAAFSLLTPETAASLHILRKVRNRFSHDPHLRAFDQDRKVMGYLNSIPANRMVPFVGPPSSLRDRYFAAAFYCFSDLRHIKPSI
jgi:hypothetical protein